MFNAEFDFNQIREVPQKVQDVARQASLELKQEQLQNNQALASQVKRLRDKYLREFYAIIGSENLERYSKFRAKRKQRLHKKRGLCSRLSIANLC